MPAGCREPPTPAEAGRGVPLWDLGVPMGGELLEFTFSDMFGSFPDGWPCGSKKKEMEKNPKQINKKTNKILKCYFNTPLINFSSSSYF